MLSFAISKNIFIEYTKITFYVCPYDNLVYIVSGGRRAVDPLSDIFPINFPTAKLHTLLLEMLLSLEFALFLQNQDVNIDAGDFNCHNIGK